MSEDDPKYTYKEKSREERRPSAMAKGSARVKPYTSVRNATITDSFQRPKVRSSRSSRIEPNSATMPSRKIREPSYQRSTVNSSAKKVNQSFDNRRAPDYSDDPTLNSKYRLITLEKKFDMQRQKSQHKIEHVSKKMEYLVSATDSQQERIRKLDQEKRET